MSSTNFPIYGYRKFVEQTELFIIIYTTEENLC